MPLRRRRDEVPIRARTTVRVRVSARWKAPRLRLGDASFREAASAASLGLRGATRDVPELAPIRAGDPGARNTPRRAFATFVQQRLPSSDGLVHDLPGPRQWSAARASRRTQVVARRLPVRQRTEQPTQPAPTGAGQQRGPPRLHSRARIEGSSGVPARRTGCRNRRAASQVQRSAVSPATGSVNGDRARSVERLDRRQRCRRLGAAAKSRASRHGQSRALERALRGKGSRWMEGIADRHPPSAFTRRRRNRSPAALDRRGRASARARTESRDSGARGTARKHRSGKTTPAAAKCMRPAEASRLS
jgi:hypothetical protein